MSVRAALLTVLAFAGTPVPTFAQSDRQADQSRETLAFVPPDVPLVLTRELRRPMSDGTEVVSQRSYEVRIERVDAGYVVNGTLLEVKVDAPEDLRQLAELERARPDTGLFPMRLDVDGMLTQTDPEPSAEPAKALSQGVQLVSEQLRRLHLPAADAAQAQAFVHQFLSRPAMTSWPIDLFRPSPGKHRDTRDLALPNGAQGQVVVETEAEALPASGLLARLDRIVTTRVDNDIRRTIETWRLSQTR